MYVLISHYRQPITGAHFRYDRLAKAIIEKGKPVIWISPQRDEYFTYSNVRFLHNSASFSRFKSLQLAASVLFNSFFLRKNRQTIKCIKVFGETPLLAALLCRLITAAPLSIGVRSDVIKRQALSLRDMSYARRFIARIKNCILNRIISYAYHKADYISVQTVTASANLIAQYELDEKKIHIIHNDLPMRYKYHENVRRLPSTPSRLIFVGNSSKIKGFDILISAIRECVPQLKIASLCVVGVCMKEALPLVSMAEEHRFELQVHERSSDVLGLMSASDLVIVPSREDQFPNVVLEALALRIPVVGSNVDGISFMLNNSCVLFDIDDTSGLPNLLKYACSEVGYQSVIENTLIQRERFDFNWEAKYISSLDSIFSPQANSKE